MASLEPRIDPYLFGRQLEAFRSFVQEKSGMPFLSFASNTYIDEQEGYKADIYRAGREALGFKEWREANLGEGEIAEATILAIELPGNNLIPWQPRYGEENRLHHPLFMARNNADLRRQLESCLFDLYRTDHDEQSFANLTTIFGRKYPLLAYLFFLKDRSKYLPIAPRSFDSAFSYLGADFKTNKQCSWQNYSAYLSLITEIKIMLLDELSCEVSLLDAHSFAWMLASQMDKQGKLANVNEYLNLTPTEREAIVKARIGQGIFRQRLLDYWSRCAVTGCREASLLRASHIKPWKVANIEERVNMFNGLLLSPNIDACFDEGYISFDDEGGIIISDRLAEGDIEKLGLRSDMRLERVETAHMMFLKFHREVVFR